VTTAPGQLASLAGVARSTGLDVPIGTNGPVFAPQLLKTPAGPTLNDNVTVFAGGAPYASEEPALTKLAASYEKTYPKGVPQQAVPVGYSEAKVMDEALKKACENKDLTRAGIVKAFRQLNAVETDGLVAGTLDFSQVGQSSSKEVFALDVDESAKGGLKVVGEPLNTETAQGYKRVPSN